MMLMRELAVPLALAAGQGLGDMIVSNFLWILLIIVGFCLVVVEMYMPGFGVPGIAGSLCLVGGVALFAKGDAVTWLVMTVIIVALLCVALSISIRSAAKGRLANSKFVLHEVTLEPGMERDMDYFIGKTGVTTTVLRPAGMGEFDGVKLNIQSDGEFIVEGVAVRVDRVEGNRIFVKKIA